MLEAAMIMTAAKKLVGVVEDPDTYKRLDGIRQFVCKVTGKEIDKAAFLELLETTTQGESYTGVWETLDGGSRRMRFEGGWVFQAQEGTNPIFVPDK